MTQRSAVMGVLLLAIAASGCDGSRSTPPPATPLTVARMELAALRGHAVNVVTLDHRADQALGDPLADIMRAHLTRAFTTSGLRVGPAGDAIVTVGIVRYRSEMEFGQWAGCVSVAVKLQIAGSPDREFPVDRCVRKPDVAGYGSADEALHSAYADTLVEILSRIDALRGPTRPAPAR